MKLKGLFIAQAGQIYMLILTIISFFYPFLENKTEQTFEQGISLFNLSLNNNKNQLIVFLLYFSALLIVLIFTTILLHYFKAKWRRLYYYINCGCTILLTLSAIAIAILTVNKQISSAGGLQAFIVFSGGTFVFATFPFLFNFDKN